MLSKAIEGTFCATHRAREPSCQKLSLCSAGSVFKFDAPYYKEVQIALFLCNCLKYVIRKIAINLHLVNQLLRGDNLLATFFVQLDSSNEKEDRSETAGSRKEHRLLIG